MFNAPVFLKLIKDYRFERILISGDHVSLRFTHMDLSNWGARQNCSLYALKVFEGRDLSSPLIGSYCSRQIPHMITSQVNVISSTQV